jgi:hypothetical protein
MLLQPLPPRSAPHLAPRISCGLDRHFGPFDALPELGGWLGTDWFTCRGCRALVTRANADLRRIAA